MKNDYKFCGWMSVTFLACSLVANFAVTSPTLVIGCVCISAVYQAAAMVIRNVNNKSCGIHAIAAKFREEKEGQH